MIFQNMSSKVLGLNENQREDIMKQGLPRLSKLVLTTHAGDVLDYLPAFPVITAWWNHAEPVVQTARTAFGIDVTLLRLLDAAPAGENVEITYLAELNGPLPPHIELLPWAGTLNEQPLRLAYARPRGPAADLAWALGILEAQGLSPVAPPVQVRTWNLSSIWRIPVQGQTVWLKNVPPFFAHEGTVMARLQDHPVPRILGHDGSRILLREIPGQDMYEADLPALMTMAEILTRLQAEWADRVDELAVMNIPDWREKPLSRLIAAAVNRGGPELDADERAALGDFVRTLPQRFAAVAACGLTDTLVHGDFHPGNVRGQDGKFTILDWGDSGIGHPMLDQAAFLERIDAKNADTLRAHWNAQYLKYAPGADPARASILFAPIAAARQAVIYYNFIDNIEPAERVYHHGDPAEWLKKTAALLK